MLEDFIRFVSNLFEVNWFSCAVHMHDFQFSRLIIMKKKILTHTERDRISLSHQFQSRICKAALKKGLDYFDLDKPNRRCT